MVVLVRFGRGLAIEFHGLLRAEMDAGEALRAVVAAMGFAVGEGDIGLRAYVSANAATYAQVGVDGGCEHRQRAALYARKGAQRAYGPPPHIVKTVRAGGNLLGNTLQPFGVFLELPDLFVGVAPETDSAIVRHADLLAVSQS